MPKKQTYKQMMADILKSKNKGKEGSTVKANTGGGVPKKVTKI